MDLNHLNLWVRDAAACRDFYQSHFGFRPAFEADGGYFVRNDDGSMARGLLGGVLTPARALPTSRHRGTASSFPGDVSRQ
jgi:catechol 2,3-dioxygenase-like lactoylglutathione lyase family enzyme